MGSPDYGYRGVVWSPFGSSLPLTGALGHVCGASSVYAAMFCANVGAVLWFDRLHAGIKWLECGLRKRQNVSS